MSCVVSASLPVLAGNEWRSVCGLVVKKGAAGLMFQRERERKFVVMHRNYAFFSFLFQSPPASQNVGQQLGTRKNDHVGHALYRSCTLSLKTLSV